VRLEGGAAVFSVDKQDMDNLFFSCFAAGCFPRLHSEMSDQCVPLVSAPLHSTRLVCKSLSLPGGGQMQKLGHPLSLQEMFSTCFPAASLQSQLRSTSRAVASAVFSLTALKRALASSPV